jgi:hypothetical protein
VNSREGWLKFAKPPLRKMAEKYVFTSKRVEGEVEYNTGRFAESRPSEGIEKNVLLETNPNAPL